MGSSYERYTDPFTASYDSKTAKTGLGMGASTTSSSYLKTNETKKASSFGDFTNNVHSFSRVKEDKLPTADSYL